MNGRPEPGRAGTRTGTARLRVTMPSCAGRGICADVLPELITLDDWGFPIIASGTVPEYLEGQAEEAVRLCPRLALRLERTAR